MLHIHAVWVFSKNKKNPCSLGFRHPNELSEEYKRKKRNELSEDHQLAEMSKV